MDVVTSRRVAVGVLFLLACAPTFAGTVDDPAVPLITVGQADAPPNVDGEIRDGEWPAASSPAAWIDLGRRSLARQQPQVWVTWDDEALFVAARLPLPAKARPVAAVTTRDGSVWEDDAMEVFLDPTHGHGDYYQFIVNSRAVQWDSRQKDPSWNADWQAKTVVAAGRWDVETRIPFAALGLRAPRPGDVWGLNVAWDRQTPAAAIASWAHVEGGLHDPAHFAHLAFAEEAPAVQVSGPGLPLAGRVGVTGTWRAAAPGEAKLSVTRSDKESVTVVAAAAAVHSGGGAATPFNLAAALPLEAGLPVPGTYQVRLTVTDKGRNVCLATAPLVIPVPLQVALRKYFLEGQVAVDLDASGLGRTAREVDAGATLLDAAGKRLQVRKFGGLTEALTGTVTFDVSKLAAGNYQVLVIAGTGRRQPSHKVTVGFTRPATPAWLGSREGISDKVLAPWTPLAVADNTVTMWGREVSFGPLPFPSQVAAAGKQMLAGPITLRMVADGKEQSWTQRGKLLAPVTRPERVELTTAAGGEGALCEGRISVDYDGMIRSDFTLTPRGVKRIEGLSLIVPLKREHARYLYHYPGRWQSAYNAGALPEQGFTAAFRPYLWLGDEERGLAWFSESDRNFFVQDPNRVTEIVREGEVVTLRINMITAAQPAGGPLTYTFGFQPTPVKPLQPDAWDYRICHHGGYGIEDREWKDAGGKTTMLDHLASLGVRTLCFHEHWTDIQNYTGTTHGEKLRKLVKACHERGIKLLLYFGYELSNIAPEWDLYAEEALVAPRAGGYHRAPEQNAYIVCYRSKWQDFMAAGIARMMDDYDIDGVYLDGTANPWGCRNTHHGCGYRKPDGTIGTTYPFFDTREMMRRIYTLVKTRKPKGLVNVHQSTCMTIPSLAWATSYWDGEQFGSIDRGPNPLDVLPLDAFRCEFMGRQWGVPAEFLCYNRPYTYSEAMAFTLLHDVLVRGSLGGSLELEARLWQGMEAFGRAGAVWIPYWDNKPYVSLGPDDTIKASVYSRAEAGAVIVVSNLGAEEKTATVKLDYEGLALSAGMQAVDMVTDEPVALSDSFAMSFPLKPFGFRVVWIRHPAG